MTDEVKTGATSTTEGASGGAGAGQQGGVPKGLEQFAGQDGKIDLEKVGKSLLESQRAFYKLGQEHSALQRSYEAIAASRTDTPAPDPEEARGKEFEKFVEDPRKYAENVARSTVAQEAKAVKAALLTMSHPELGDAEFRKGLEEFTATLPPHIQGGLSDFYTADWVVKLYKQQLKPNTPSTDSGGGDARQRLESPSGSPSKGGKTWKRSEIRKLQRENPEAYAAQADEIQKAYEEGRVLKDQ